MGIPKQTKCRWHSRDSKGLLTSILIERRFSGIFTGVPSSSPSSSSLVGRVGATGVGEPLLLLGLAGGASFAAGVEVTGVLGRLAGDVVNKSTSVRWRGRGRGLLFTNVDVDFFFSLSSSCKMIYRRRDHNQQPQETWRIEKSFNLQSSACERTWVLTRFFRCPEDVEGRCSMSGFFAPCGIFFDPAVVDTVSCKKRKVRSTSVWHGDEEKEQKQTIPSTRTGVLTGFLGLPEALGRPSIPDFFAVSGTAALRTCHITLIAQARQNS
jgi:hypothetical protein